MALRRHQILVLLLANIAMVVALSKELVVEGEASRTLESNSVGLDLDENLTKGGTCHVEYQVVKRVAGRCVKLGKTATGCVAGVYIQPLHPEFELQGDKTSSDILLAWEFSDSFHLALKTKMMQKHQYMSFNIKVLKLMNMWPSEKPEKNPKWKQWQSYYIFVTLIPCFIPVLTESIVGVGDSDMSMAEEAQVLLATICILGMLQLGVCFLRNAEKIKKLVDDLSRFKKYSNLNMIKIDKLTTSYSKIFFAYSIVGTLIYTFMPFTFVNSCETNKPLRMQKYNIPCGIIVPYRLPFRFDKSPVFEIVAVYTAYLASVTTIIIVTITTLVCSIISHVIGHLRELRRHILSIPPGNVPGVDIRVRRIIQYHCAIIEYVDEVNDAFGTQLIAHRLLTSFVISILGFVIIRADNFGEWLRFSMHLFGWLVLIYLVCHYGQTLIDESLGIAVDIYYIEWHTKPVFVQKYIRMIIMRAQKPIVLKAVKVETFSANTFVGILRAAYTVFTLLLNVRK